MKLQRPRSVLYAIGLAWGLNLCWMHTAFAQRRGGEERKSPVEWAGELVPLRNSSLNVSDDSGGTWWLSGDGGIERDEEELFSGGNRLVIGGQSVSPSGYWGFGDGRGLACVMANVPNRLRVTRIVSVLNDPACVRTLEILENPTDKPIETGLEVIHSFNFPMLDMPSKSAGFGRDSSDMQWIETEMPEGRSKILVITAGAKAKNCAKLASRRGNSNFQMQYAGITVPAQGKAVVMHVVAKRKPTGGAEKGGQITERQLVRSVPLELRRDLVNFRRATWCLNGREVLRGEADDVVELVNKQQLHGALEPGPLKLKTSFGEVIVPGEQLASWLSQMDGEVLITRLDGQAFLGKLATDQIPLKLNTGQKLQLPISRIYQLGTRSLGQDPEAWESGEGLIQMRDGQRIRGRLDGGEVSLVTRHGVVKIPTAILSCLVCRADQPLHRAVLANGTVLTGLLATDTLPIKFDDFGAQRVSWDRLNAISGGAGAGSATQPRGGSESRPGQPGEMIVQTNGEERLVGTVDPPVVALHSEFLTMDIPLAQCKQIETLPDYPPGWVSVEMWDGTKSQGRLTQPSLQITAVKLPIKVNVGMISRILNPAPALPPGVVEQVGKFIAQLNDAEAVRRDAAQERLLEIGKAAVPLLREALKEAKPEVQSRLEQILQRLEPSSPKDRASGSRPQPQFFDLDNSD